MALYKPKNCNEWKYWFIYKGKRIWGRTNILDDGKKATFKLAEQVFIKDQNDYVLGKTLGYASNIFLEDLLKDYLKKYCTNQASYESVKMSAYKTFCEFFKGRHAVDIKRNDLFLYRDWLMTKRKRLVKGNTFNRYICVLSNCYEKAILDGTLKINPCHKFPKFNEREFARRRIITKEELFKLWSNFSLIMRQIIIFANETGLRKGEIRNILWEHLDISKRLIGIPENKERNPVKIIGLTIDALRILLKRPKIGPYVFCDDKGLQLKADGLIRTEFNRIRKKLGLADIKFHDIRHRFGTTLLKSGANLKTVSEALGHSNIETTASTYTNLDSEYILGQLDRMPSLLSEFEGKSPVICDAGVMNNLSIVDFSRN